jgi:hypothetical protein
MPTSNSPGIGIGSPSRQRRTTKPVTGSPSRWFPQRKDFKSYQEWDTHYRAYQHIYSLQDKVRELASQVQAGATRASGKPAGDPLSTSNQVSASHILGIAVKAGVPKDGQVLTYKAKEGQYVFV